jgi:hypothetical protein
MATYTESLQEFWKMYEAEKGEGSAVNSHDVAEWAYHKGLWKPRPKNVIDILADDLARAWREEYRFDRLGRRYRAKHAVRTSENGKQMTLWADIDTASHPHMQRAFAQRRQQVVGDCLQLKTDVDVYNDLHINDSPIQVVLDFTHDVEELQYLQTDKLKGVA